MPLKKCSKLLQYTWALNAFVLLKVYNINFNKTLISLLTLVKGGTFKEDKNFEALGWHSIHTPLGHVCFEEVRDILKEVKLNTTKYINEIMIKIDPTCTFVTEIVRKQWKINKIFPSKIE